MSPSNMFSLFVVGASLAGGAPPPPQPAYLCAPGWTPPCQPVPPTTKGATTLAQCSAACGASPSPSPSPSPSLGKSFEITVEEIAKALNETKGHPLENLIIRKILAVMNADGLSVQGNDIVRTGLEPSRLSPCSPPLLLPPPASPASRCTTASEP